MGREGERQEAGASPFYYSNIGFFTVFYDCSADISAGRCIRKKLAMLEHHPGNL
jgi:hypothetical protein